MHCKSAIPVIENLATKLPDQQFGVIDCDTELEGCKYFNVSGYPAIFLIKDGNIY